MKNLGLLAISGLIVLFIVSCSNDSQSLKPVTTSLSTPTEEVTDVRRTGTDSTTSTPEIVELLSEPKSTSTPIQLSLPRPIQPGDAQPQSKEVISSTNIQDLELLSTWGKGNLADMEFIPHTSRLVVATQIGFWEYDVDNLKEVRYIPTESGVESIDFSWDGKHIAAKLRNDHLLIYDQDWNLIKQIEIEGGYDRIRYTQSGNILLISSCEISIINPTTEDFTRFAFNLLEDTPDATVCDNDKFQSVALSPDGRQLAVGTENNVCLIWDLESREIQQRITDFENEWDDSYPLVKYSPDGRYLITQFQGDAIRFWDTSTLELGKSIALIDQRPDPSSWISLNRLAIGTNNNLIAFTSNEMVNFEFPSLQFLQVVEINEYMIGVRGGNYAVQHKQVTAVDDSGQFGAFIEAGGSVVILQTNPYQELYRETGYFWGFNYILPITGTPIFIINAPDVFIDPQTKQTLLGWDFNQMAPIDPLIIDPGYYAGQSLVIRPDGTSIDKVYKINFDEYFKSDPSQLIEWPPPYLEEVGQVPDSIENQVVSPDLSTIAGTGGIWDLKTGQKLAENLCERDILYSENGNWIGCLSSDDNFIIIDINNNFTELTLDRNLPGYDAVYYKFSPDGNYLGTLNSGFDTLAVWDLNTKSIVWSINYESEEDYSEYKQILNFIFTPDSEVILFAVEGDSVIRAWRVGEGTEISTISSYGNNIWDWYFSEDRKTLITLSENGTLNQWGIP